MILNFNFFIINRQDSLTIFATADTIAGEQTWPTEDEMKNDDNEDEDEDEDGDGDEGVDRDATEAVDSRRLPDNHKVS